MPANQLSITIIQPDVAWEDKEANLRTYEEHLSAAEGTKEIVLLPEMFSTGFTMNPSALAEGMDGATVSCMKEMARKHRCILAGSLIIEEDGKYYNRIIWMQPDGKFSFYNKRHLFGYAGEVDHYTAGDKKLVVSVKGWKIMPMVCYDLRFPIWSRNAIMEEGPALYDVLVYVANWPEKRSLAWRTLLQARAIENMSYVVGVNRMGKDGNGHNYKGESSIFGPLGEQIWQADDKAVVKTIILEKDPLDKIREDLPFLRDADKYILL
jgi:omega-amidase